MGRGTTPLQAALMGRRPAGNDINPLATLLLRPRLNPPDPARLARLLVTMPWQECVLAELSTPDLLAFYHPTTLRELEALRAWLLAAAPPTDQTPDPSLDWLRMVALNRLTGHSPGFFSVYTMPPNQAVSVAGQLKINAKRAQIPPPRDIAALIARKSNALLKDGVPPLNGPALLGTAPAADSPFVPTAGVALTVTSPPFLDVVQYGSDNWLRNWFAGIPPGSIAIDHIRGEAAWAAAMRATLTELARITRPGGHVAFEVGEVRGGKVMLERLVWEAAEGLPFERLGVLINAQNFTKTAHCWGVGNNRGGTNTNRIVVLRRH
jgi:hypothetical protein